MIGVDTNILVYSHRRDSEWFEAARSCVASLWKSGQSWFIPWPCLHEFYCVVTHPRLYKPPTTPAGAIAQIEAWLSSPKIVLGSEGNDYWSMLRSLAPTGRVVGPLVYDARIAAICLQAGVTTLWTADRDFSRFPLLHCENPLIPAK